jgi:hypothetical protein
MHILTEILHDLLYFLIIVNVISAVVIWVMGIHQRFLMLEDLPDGRGWLSLRRVLPSELPERYHARRCQSIRLLFAFFAVLIIESFLFWLDILIFRNPS